jgi:hypothetical protein
MSRGPGISDFVTSQFAASHDEKEIPRMSIDTREEQVYPLPAIRRYLPPSTRTGKPVHPSVIFRWIKTGLKASDGTVVRLDAVKAGGSLCTSREAVERFFSELTVRSGLSVQTPVATARDREKTSGELATAGLK